MLDRPLAFLDLETTGATASFDRITEIGLIEVEHGALVREWSTLVNPEMRIPPFIEALTGISNDMVALAPTFAEVAQELKARLHGKLLIAHNARFDYGFLKAEFGRLDSQVLVGARVHGETLAQAFPRPCASQPRQPDGAPRRQLRCAPPRARRRARAVGPRPEMAHGARRRRGERRRAGSD